MKYVLALLAIVNFSGCAVYADYANSNDPCQSYGKREGYQKPAWCGASTGRTVTVTQPLGRHGPYVISK